MDEQKCRGCRRPVGEGIPRYNDQIMPLPFEHESRESERPAEPICLGCAEERPDEWHKLYLKVYNIQR